MKLKIAIGIALLSASVGTAHAQQGINLSGVVTPLLGLANVGLPLLNPVLQPILTQTGPIVGQLVTSLHPAFVGLAPVFTIVDTGAGLLHIPAITLPGLP